MTAEAEFPVRNVLLCVSGGVSAALAPAWSYWAQQTYGVRIRAVLTETARTFVKPEALAAVTGHEVVVDDARITRRGEPMHLLLANWAEVTIVAPATGNTIAKLAQGIADNVLCATVLNGRGPVIVAPSLNETLARAPSTLRNLEQLHGDGCGIVPTVEGLGVSDRKISPGAMPDAPAVFEFARKFLDQQRLAE